MLYYTSKGLSNISKTTVLTRLDQKTFLSQALIEESIKIILAATGIGFLKEVVVSSNKLIVWSLNRHQYRPMV
jgi:hypothetical protein